LAGPRRQDCDHASRELVSHPADGDTGTSGRHLFRLIGFQAWTTSRRLTNHAQEVHLVFRSREALQTLLERTGLLRPNLRILDAGAGFGTATFAVLDALRRRNIEPETIDGFDLTPAMLARFRAELDSRGITQVRLKQANVLQLDQQLPSSWGNYDLIVSASMLEYVGRRDLSKALSALGARLAPHGTLLVVITRKNWITKILIDGGGKRHVTRAGSFEKLLRPRVSAILYSADSQLATSGRAFRTMWSWPNGRKRSRK